MKIRHVLVSLCLATGALAGASTVALADFTPWFQVGDDVYADGVRGRSSVTGAAFSATGDRYALGEERWNRDRGRIRVFELDGDTWVQVGSGFVGSEPGERVGTQALAMSADGKTVAFHRSPTDDQGAVDVFTERNGVWERVGERIDGVPDERLGQFLTMSDDGLTLAVTSESGTRNVRMFTLVDNAWEQLGDSINSLGPEDEFGSSLAVSANGRIVAAGAIRSSRNGVFSTGQVRVFQFGQGEWTQLGNTLNGTIWLDELGSDVALSDNGSALAVTSRKGTDEAFAGRGGLQMFDLVDGTWVQIGETILGPEFSSSSDDTVAMTPDGRVVAWGTPRRELGEVNVYTRVDDSWVSVGPAITASGPSVVEQSPPRHKFGSQVGLAADGASVMVASTLSAEEKDPDRRGYVRVYRSTLCSGAVPTLVGTSGDDVLTGTPGRDVILGLQGNDTIRGLGGDDIICAGVGDDVIIGGLGFDVMFGAQGNDTIYFANGQEPGQRADSAGGRAFGGAGNDDIYGSDRWDRMQGGPGNDRLSGFGGRDWMRAGPGADRVEGGAGIDTVHGGNGNDRIIIDGPDEVRGGAGNADVCDVRSGVPAILTSCEQAS